jgi:hypothetical protein
MMMRKEREATMISPNVHDLPRLSFHDPIHQWSGLWDDDAQETCVILLAQTRDYDEWNAGIPG